MHKPQNPLGYLFKKTWEYSAGNHVYVVLYWLLSMVAELVDSLFLPFLWAKVIEVVITQGITSESTITLWWLLAGVFARVVVSWAFHAPSRLIESSNAFYARINYRRFLLKGVLTLPLEWHVGHHSGDTIDKIEKGTIALFDFSECTFQIIRSFVQLIISFVILMYFSTIAACIVVIMIAVSAWITMRFDRVLITQYQVLNESENLISERVFDVISNIASVIILRVERLVFNAIMRTVEKPFDLVKQNNRLNELKWFMTSVCCTAMSVLVLGVYFWQHFGAAPGVIASSVYLLINYLDRIGGLFYQFTEMYGTIVRRSTRVGNSEILSEDFKPERFLNHTMPPTWKRLSIDHLSFSYQSGDECDLHLEDVSFEFTHGQRIALVGSSGSGKTTLLKVMRDLYHPMTLDLSIDGTPISEGFEGISQAIALIPQDPEIFATSILANITMGAEYDATLVRRFTDMACFTEVIATLPRGLESSIQERGVNLSGGQQQRLALSRGLLACHDKDIVLLDEPTSSLDTMTEMRVYQNIFREFQGKTIVSSIHRLHLLPMFDCIYIFEGGRIVASGTFEELLATTPEFQKLWHHYIDHRENTHS